MPWTSPLPWMLPGLGQVFWGSWRRKGIGRGWDLEYRTLLL